MADVFISYKREERQAIERLALELRKLGLNVWFDASLNAGEAFSDEIDREAHGAKAIVVCWSPTARESPWVKSEALIGFEGRKLVACYVAGPDGFYPPTPFNSIHAEDLRAWIGAPSSTHAAYKSVLRRIGFLCGRADIESYGALDVQAPASALRSWIAIHEASPLFVVVDELLRTRDAEEAERTRLEQEARERRAREEAERKAREEAERQAREERERRDRVEREERERRSREVLGRARQIGDTEIDAVLYPKPSSAPQRKWWVLIIAVVVAAFAIAMFAIAIALNTGQRQQQSTTRTQAESSPSRSAGVAEQRATQSFLNDLSCDALENITETSLRQSFAGDASSGNVDVGEGNAYPATILFAGDPERRLEVIWDPSTRRLWQARISGESSRWRGPRGLRLGMNVFDVERINGSPFVITGWGWDYGGRGYDWRPGLLAHEDCRIVVEFSANGTVPIGEQDYQSSSESIRASNPTVRAIILIPRT